MADNPSNEVYSPSEIARAVGIGVRRLREILGRHGSVPDFIPHADAVRIGRMVLGCPTPDQAPVPSRGSVSGRLFSVFASPAATHRPGLSLVISAALHAVLIATFLAAAMERSTHLTTVQTEVTPDTDLRLVFITTPGPGGGGGGGGRLEPAPVPRAQRAGPRALSSPVPERRPPAPSSPRPEPELATVEPLPTVVSPLASLPADATDRKGALEDSAVANDSHGPSVGGGTGLGTGSGMGPGDGPGIGPGSGGGLGGGPFRPGSGAEPPRLVYEVKADYTENARRAGIEGEVVLEVVVRRDGSVSDIRLLQPLGHGLDERAVTAVRRWRFAPATLAGTTVDVIVEIAVEFRLT